MRYNEQQVAEQSKQTKEKKPTATPKQGQYTSKELKETKNIITGRGVI